MIKPGSVCYLVGQRNKEYEGRVVTALRRDWSGAGCYQCGNIGRFWDVHAPWVAWKEPMACECALRPIDDPDEPVTTHTPEALTA